MPSSTRISKRPGGGEYRDHVGAVDRFLAANFSSALGADERAEVRQDAFLALFREQSQAVRIKNEEAFLIKCARNAALSRLRSADRRRRWSFDPHDSPEARLPDPAPSPDMVVIAAESERATRAAVARLDGRSRELLALFLCGWTVPEVAERLQVSTSHGYKLFKKAGTAVLA